MSTDWIRLNPQIDGEIRHRSIINGLQKLQSITNPFTFGSVKNLRIRSILRIDEFFVHLCSFSFVLYSETKGLLLSTKDEKQNFSIGLRAVWKMMTSSFDFYLQGRDRVTHMIFSVCFTQIKLLV